MTIDTLSHKRAIDKCEELAALVDWHTGNQGNGVYSTAIAPLEFHENVILLLQCRCQQTASRDCDIRTKRLVAKSENLSVERMLRT